MKGWGLAKLGKFRVKTLAKERFVQKFKTLQSFLYKNDCCQNAALSIFLVLSQKGVYLSEPITDCIDQLGRQRYCSPCPHGKVQSTNRIVESARLMSRYLTQCANKKDKELLHRPIT